MSLCDKCKYTQFGMCPAEYSDTEYAGTGPLAGTLVQCDVFENANLNEPRGEWPIDKPIEDFKQIAYNLRQEGQISRADAVMYLIERVKIAEGRTLGLVEVDDLRNDIKEFAMLFAGCIDETTLNEIRPTETKESLRQKYLTDPVFHAKASSISNPVLHIINKYLR